ncbi:biofilm peroxide resistance protein BsmA [Escherichia coli]|nr:biofilm peroxide resistance protein BsmA [Escherichia coli]EHY1329401.1 biofilm peroxide resistance protein BsmA [Escherichia coli]EHY1388530.1 biofilm peroxide resistance protein BsmA [Escherichia coli]EHY1602457.1 biofilm peroxide resistance protein BsmA [Escherichia coli]EKE0033407.1 biofilm peroxide resistance protein BsmA [Escherichia coli]
MVSRKRNSVIYRFASLLLVLMLSACSALQGTPQPALQGTPQPAPPVTDHPQEIRRDQTQGLQRIGSVSTMVRGSPDDALAEIRAKAVAAKADYYVVVMVDETIVTGQWYSQAILYRK